MSEIRRSVPGGLAGVLITALAIAVCWVPQSARAQISSYSAGGYLSDLLSHYDGPILPPGGTPFPEAKLGDWQNNLQLRLNLHWYPSQNIAAAFESRSLLVCQRNIGRGTLFEDQIDPDLGLYFDLDATGKQRDAVLVAAVDRLWVDWTRDKLEITAGRQRIAWGTCLVWNPADLFNPYNVLDFDYDEKPGADAIRVQVYTGAVSKVEFAGGPGRTRETVTYAARWLTGLWDYDTCLIAGWQRQFWRLGGTWAGQIGSGGFRGEVIYSKPGATVVLGPGDFPGKAGEGPGIWMAGEGIRTAGEGIRTARDFWTVALSYDYTFSNSLYLNSEALYNGMGTTGDAGLRRLETLITAELTPARYSIFQEVAYDITPLLRGRVFGILNPSDRSWVSMLGLTYSFATDWELLLFALPAGGRAGTEFGDLPGQAGLRIRFYF
ncbi:MAG: hypothetical protein PVH52_03175 [bacterium]